MAKFKRFQLLTIADIEQSDFDDCSKQIYINAAKQGADIVFLGETRDGYDVSILFTGGLKH